MSNRLTFSLASLIVLIFALAFAAAPVMAEAPTVTITEDTRSDYVQTRSDFRVKIAFSAVVTGFTADDVTVSGATSSTAGFTTYTDVTFTAGTGTGEAGKVWYLSTLDIGTNNADHTHSVVRVSIPAGAATAGGVGNVAASKNFTSLPTVIAGTLTLSLDETTLNDNSADLDVVDGKLQSQATFSVKFTSDLATAPASLLRSAILINGDKANPGTDVNGVDVADTSDPAFDSTTKVATIQFQVGPTAITPVRIGLNPNYAKATEITVPQLPKVTLTQQGDVDTTDKEFAVRLTFTEPVSSFDKSNIKFYQANADGTKSTNPALVTVTLVGQDQVWVAECRYKFEILPLYVTVSNSVVASVTPEGGLKIGESMPAVDAPDKPTAAAPKGTSRDIVINWKALTDTTVIGYQLKVYRGDKKTATTLVPGTLVPGTVGIGGTIGTAANPITGTTYIYRAAQADRGKYFAFTIAGVTADGVGTHSAKSSAVQVPGLFTFGGEKGPDIEICEGDTKTTGKKRDDGTYENGWQLPLAFGGEESENITYKLAEDAKGKAADLPIGFDWDTRDHQLRTIKRTDAEPATSEKAVTYYWIASLEGHEDEHTTFTIHVKPHQLPETPDGLMVSKVDADDTNPLTMNKVELTWEQPELKDTYDDCIPYPQNYVVYVEKLNDLTGEFVKPSILDPTTPVVKDEYTSVPTELAAGGESPSADEAKFTRKTVKGTEKVATHFTAQFPRGIYRFKVAAHNVSQKSHNKDDPTKDMGLSMPSKDFAEWAKLGDEEHIVVADPPAAPMDLRAAIHTGSKVTVNWLKVTDDGGAPVEDDASDSETKAARDKYYGEGAPATTDFGGYVLYQVNQANNDVVRYPAEDVADTLDIADYDHPTFQTGELAPGEYVFRVTAKNIAGESLRSESTPYSHVRVVATSPTDNEAPDFGDATIASITATVGQPIAGRFLPKATDADGDTLTYSIVDAAGNATTSPGGLTFVPATRALTGSSAAAMAEAAYTYTVTDGKASDTIGFFITVNAAVKTPDSVHLTATHANGVTTLSGTLGANGFGTVGADALPNIRRFFAEGGSISVLSSKTGAVAKDVVISEIMWGLDLNQGTGNQANQQFIELYNTTNAAISLSMVTIEFDSTNAVPAVPSGKTLLDQVSNVSGGGWLITDAPGSSGNIPTATNAGSANLISMYRDINYDKVEKTDHDADATKNREAQLKDFPDGNALGSWKASDKEVETYGLNLVGSPRSKHFVAFKPLTASAIDRGQVIINEIGNHSGDKYDWIELRDVRTSGDPINLKKWELSQVTDDKKDTQLVSFPDNDNHKIAAGGILLIVNSDPYRDPDHPLAAGTRINTGNPEATGTDTRYYVDSGLKLKDSGKTLLILRSANDKEGKAEALKDVVGTLSIADNAASLRTKMWPLVATGAAHGNVIDGTDDEDFRAGKVYKRNNAGGGTGEKHLGTVGYTGVGYKRSAASSGQNGGTPGYANDAVKVNEADLAGDSTVSISEIMYARGNNLPQWIELHNNSMTQAVNLNEWKLKIEHSRDVDDVDIRYPAVTTNNFGGSIHIQPNQTVLIVSTTTGRVSRSAQGGVDFPSTRVINLWGQKDRLEVESDKTRRSYRLLSQTAFKITLMDKSGAAVDVAGNLAADGTAMWELPMAEDGRSSVIRRYETKEPIDGTMGASWILASQSPLAHIQQDTYYGSADDIGTPGFRAGGPLPVSLSKFRPERLDDGSIVVRWITESELNNAGFNILRSETRNGEFKQINTKLIAGKGTTSERTAYEWKDTSAKPNVVYYYQIQDVSLDGQVQTLRQSRLKGNVTAAGKLTTTWGELKALQ